MSKRTNKMKKKSKQETKVDANIPAQVTTRMLARCEDCIKGYIPRGRKSSGLEVSNLQLFYIPNNKLDPDKNGLVCPMHKDSAQVAGLILSEDCLHNKFGSAMGMIAFRFSDNEVLVARQNQIWPKPKIGRKIELDTTMLSSLSDEQILEVIRKVTNEVAKK